MHSIMAGKPEAHGNQRAQIELQKPEDPPAHTDTEITVMHGNHVGTLKNLLYQV